MFVVDCDGTRVAFEVDAPSSTRGRSPLLLLHGLGASGAQVRDAFPFRDRVRITPDLPGHGESPACRSGFKRFAQLLLVLLDVLGLERVDLGGISMGGAISLAVALRAPHRVRRLLLVRPAWLDRPALPQLRLVSELGARITADGVKGAAAWLHGDPEWRSLDVRVPLAAAAVRAPLAHPRAAANAAVLTRMVADRPFDRLDALGALRCPVLVLGNDDDPLHPAALARTLAGAIPGAAYEHLPPRYRDPAGHAAALRRSCLAFLDDGAADRPDNNAPEDDVC